MKTEDESMAFQSDTDRLAAERETARDPALDPARDPALRTRYARARPASALWIVAGIIILLGALAIWSGMFDSGTNTATETSATPPAAEAPAPAPQTPQPAPAQ
jgi:hypothetical protein